MTVNQEEGVFEMSRKVLLICGLIMWFEAVYCLTVFDIFEAFWPLISGGFVLMAISVSIAMRSF